MKRLALIIGALVMAVCGVQAQNCEVIMLPFFGNNPERMADCPADKVFQLCCYARAALYESDTVPAGADLYSITEVQQKGTDIHLDADYVVDLETLSYFGYTFHDFQLRYPHGDKTLCFSTPASTHPYLVLRSIEETGAVGMQMFNELYRAE